MFEESLNRFSSASVPKAKRRKKRKLGANGFIRMLALCFCIGILVFSGSKIVERMEDLSAADRFYGSNKTPESAVPRQKASRVPMKSLDLLAFLGSDRGTTIEQVELDDQEYYEYLREAFFKKKSKNPDCIGYIAAPGVIGRSHPVQEYPIMKGRDNDYYLYRLPDGTSSSAGSIFADYRLSDDYDINMNTIIYGHCMTDKSMFRGIKLFFDDANRKTIAQDMKIFVVTGEAVYVYTYFSGYRSEGNYFTYRYNADSAGSDNYYYYLKNLRSLNTITKEVSYNAKSRIITLVTCTNVPGKPDERYVLHGILTDYIPFGE